jgi:D-glycero-D-manno-heptose 1,7-bisphosphate phosphatase
MKRAVFLDRDGVLNRAVTRSGTLFVPASLAELELLPNVAEALESLHAAGFLLVMVTNQPDVRRGLVSHESVESINAYMGGHFPLDEIRVCYHVDEDRCACRKPMPGMIYAAAVAHEVDLGRSYMVGDRWRDIGAGKAAGCTTILVNRYRERIELEADIELPDLPAAAAWIVKSVA